MRSSGLVGGSCRCGRQRVGSGDLLRRFPGRCTVTGVVIPMAWKANRLARERARRPKPLKLLARPDLAEVGAQGLERCWSPQQIAGRLRVEHPNDPHWWVSHETIYRSLYLQGRGGLRQELLVALRSGRTRRRPHGRRLKGHPKIKDMVMISDRPAEVADRAVPGHWEGDLIMGTREGHSHIGTLVERTSRFVMLVNP